MGSAIEKVSDLNGAEGENELWGLDKTHGAVCRSGRLFLMGSAMVNDFVDNILCISSKSEKGMRIQKNRQW